MSIYYRCPLCGYEHALLSACFGLWCPRCKNTGKYLAARTRLEGERP